MKKLSLLLAALLVAGAATGCKDKAAEAPEAQQAQQQQQQPVENGAADADAAQQAAGDQAGGDDSDAQDDDSDEDDTVDEETFVKAAYEVNCVKSKITDPEEQKSILEVIYPRYGFETVEEFADAETSFKDSPTAKSALDEKMKNCTVEVARGFKIAGADQAPAGSPQAGSPAGSPQAGSPAGSPQAGQAAAADQAKAADTKDDKKAAAAKKAPAKPYQDSSFSAPIKDPKIQSGTLKCSTYQGTIRCQLTGKAEGKGFSVAASGKVNNAGFFRITGSNGTNHAAVSGQLKGKSGSGKINLKIFERNYNSNW